LPAECDSEKSLKIGQNCRRYKRK